MNPFVIMCSSENENHSSLVSALETYHIQFYHNRAGKDQISKMVKNSICLAEDNNNLYGAMIDSDRYGGGNLTMRRYIFVCVIFSMYKIVVAASYIM